MNALVPPQVPEAQESLLGALLTAGALGAEKSLEVAHRLGETGLQASHFYSGADSKDARVYRACLELVRRGEPTEPLLVIRELERHGWLEEIGGRSRIHELATLAPSTANAPHFASLVVEAANARRTIMAAAKIAQTAANGFDRARIAELVAELQTSATAAARTHTWQPVDLAGLALGPPEPATIGGLFYPGRRHVVSGETESLKSWLVLLAMVDEVRADRTVVFIDVNEMGCREMSERLRLLGLTTDELRGRFVYLEPDEPLTDPAVRADLDRLIADRAPSMVALDATIGAFALHGLDPHSAIDVERFHVLLVKPLRAGGAATVVIDHLPKAKDGRGKFAIGSERKIGGVDVHLGMEGITPFGRGRTGRARVMTHKDRPGYLPRPKAAELELVSDPETGRITWTIQPAEGADGAGFRPTYLMRRVSEYLEQQTAPLSKSRIVDEVEGKRPWLFSAINHLLDEGYASEEPSGGLVLVRPFTESTDG